jgi:hypothetical protein
MGICSPTILLPVNSLTVIRGASKTLQLSVSDQFGKPTNLTNALIVMTVKDRVEDLRHRLQKTSTDSTQVQIIDPFGGIAQIFLAPSDTKRWDIKPYVFDIWVFFTNGSSYVVIPPTTFDLQAGVTQWP